MARQPIAKQAPEAAPTARGLSEEEAPRSVDVPPVLVPPFSPAYAPSRIEPTLSAGEARVKIVHGSVMRMGKEHKLGAVLVLPEREAAKLVAAGACVVLKE